MGKDEESQEEGVSRVSSSFAIKGERIVCVGDRTFSRGYRDDMETAQETET